MNLPSNPAAILANSMSASAGWVMPFQPNHIRLGRFHVSREETIPVVMMDQTGWFRYRDYGSFHVLELPFQSAAVAMVIVLPKAADGLATWRATEFTSQNYGKWLAELSPVRAHVTIPRFKQVDEIDLKPALEAMGMQAAFQPGVADFSGMTGSRDLYISAVMQKTFLQVDGDGTQPKVATAVGTDVRMAATGADPTIVFNADRPFFFDLREVKLGVSLLMGQMTRPRFDPVWMGEIVRRDEADKIGSVEK